MGLFDHWPYTNFHELNLSWVLRQVIELKETVNNFVILNTIKYADPIQWNITTQYEANTIVVDPQTGTAYISSQPVPAGVALTNTDYWSVIFDLDIAQANNNITLRDDGNNVISSFASNTGDWLLWNGTLYRVSQNINLNEAYVVGYNLDRYTVEMFIRDYVTQLLTIIGNLDDLNTTDKDSIVDAINEVLTTLTTTTGDLNDLNTTDNSNLVAAINELVLSISAIEGSIYINVKDYGAIGDGNTNDTAAIQAAVNAAISSGKNKVFVPEGTYLIRCHDPNMTYTTSPYMPVAWNDPDRHYGVTLYSNLEFFMDDNAVLKSIPHSQPESVMLRACQVDGLYIHGGHLIGEKANHVNSGIPGWDTDEWNVGIMIGWGDNCTIEDVEIEQFTGHGMYIGAAYNGSDVNYTYTDFMSHNILIDHLYIHNNREVGFQLSHGIGHKINNCVFKENKDANAPYGGGLSLEGEAYGTLGIYEYVTDATINECLIDNNNYFGLSLSDVRRVVVSNCIFENQNDSLSLYRNARNIDIHDCIMKGRTTYAGLNVVDNACADIAFHDNKVYNGRLRITHGTQTADTSIYDLKVYNNHFSGFIAESDNVDLEYFVFNYNTCEQNDNLSGTLQFYRILTGEIIGNIFSTDPDTNNITLSASYFISTKINNNRFMYGGGAAILATSEYDYCEICGNDIRNYNRSAKRSVVGGPAYYTKYCNNVFRPNLSHTNGFMMSISSDKPAIATGNVLMAVVNADSILCDGLINTNGTNKVMYGNKAVTGSLTNVLNGSNLTSIDDDITNATF